MQYVELLEGRRLFASYAAATVPELIAAMNAANGSAEADTITLAAGATFTLNAVNNTSVDAGPTGLPAITEAGGDLTFLGNGATIERSTAAGTPAFRLLRAEPGPILTVKDVTLQGGLATAELAQKSAARGGAIYYPEGGGLLWLENVVVQNNRALGADGRTVSSFGFDGQDAEGGGVYGAYFKAVGCTFHNNLAQGGRSMDGGLHAGGDAKGGGIFGSGSPTNCLITANTARGGNAGTGGARGGGASGGGAYLYGFEFRGCTITNNSAVAGTGATRKLNGTAVGGGVTSARGTLRFDVFTLDHMKGNTAAGRANDIAGYYYRMA